MKATRTIFRAYLATVMVGAAVLLSLTGLFNFYIDPYDIFGGPRLDGINQHKPAKVNNSRVSKAFAVKHIKPETIILGTSRAENGLDPYHPSLIDKPVFNLALKGGEVYENYRYLQHAIAQGELKTAIIAADYSRFYVGSRSKPGFEEYYFDVDEYGRPTPLAERLKPYLSNLWSFSAIKQSLKTVSNQKDGPYYFSNGMQTPVTKQRRVLAYGPAFAFEREEKHYLEDYFMPVDSAKKSLSSPSNREKIVEYFARMLVLAHRENIHFHILISPSHARLWEAVYTAGLWEDWEQWKVMLVSVNERVASELGRSPFPVWDFAGYSQFSTETIPQSKQLMEWYWDASHYRPALGDIVLDTLMARDGAEVASDTHFGALVTSGNIEQRLAKVRKMRLAYVNKQ